MLAVSLLLLLIVLPGASLAQPASSAIPLALTPILDIIDEELEQPLGNVVDVAVADSVVYLLDQQTYSIRRIHFSGRVLPSLGQYGEGPGDITWPGRLVVTRDERCLVVQEFVSRVVCITLDGETCDTRGIEEVREAYQGPIWLRADADPQGRLVLCALVFAPTAAPGLAPGKIDESNSMAWVKRFDPATGEIATLITTEKDNTEPGVIIIPWKFYATILKGWDMNARGELVCLDPAGEYRVLVSPSPGVSPRLVPLAEAPGDADRFRRHVDKLEADVGDVGRIWQVRWLGNEHLLVRPVSEADPEPRPGMLGVYDVFDRAGTRKGRYDLRGAFEPRNDMVYDDGGTLVVIAGGQAVARAMFSAFLPPDALGGNDAPPVDEVRIRAYNFGEVLATTGRQTGDR